MGNLAASGGYYIASAGDYIVAEATTLTGSIGIFGLIPNAEDLAQKLGVNLDVVQTNKFADLNIGLPIKSFSPEQKALIQRTVERGYDLFLSRVATGRKMTKEEVDRIGQGRVWLGSKAKELGLVDELGGLNTAIEKAAELAELEEYGVLYPKTRSNLLELFGQEMYSNGFVASIGSMFVSKEEQELMSFLRKHKSYIGLQTRLPYNLKAY
ncbi:protease 4-like [Globicephala melas]|uniref:protease 4-like n=1 Tax=Globicephala melas TaxID=9731 RepID=UPI003872E1BD